MMAKGFLQDLRERTLAVFRYWSCALLLVLLPGDFLYRIDAFLSARSFAAIATDFSLMVLILGCSAVLPAVAIGGASSLLALLGALPGRAVLIVNRLLVWFLVDLFFIIYLNLWSATVVSPAHNGLRHVMVAGIFLLFNLAVLLNVRKMDGITERVFKVVPLLAALSVAVVVVKVAAVSFSGGEPAAPVRQEAVKKRNVILVTFDAMTAADMSLYGYRRDTTPNMSEFARKSFVFERMYSNSNHTSPSVCSILTGTYPCRHEVYNNFMALPEEARRDNLAAVLKKNGYTTAAVMASQYAHPWHNKSYRDFSYLAPVSYVPEYLAGRCYNAFTPVLLKLDSDVYDWFYSIKEVVRYHAYKYFLRYAVSASPMQAECNELFLIGNKKWNTEITNPPELTFREASRFLDGHKEGPFFLWVHVFTPHAPYLPPEQFKYRYLRDKAYDSVLSQSEIAGMTYQPKDQQKIDQLRARYDEMVLYTDHEFGEFVKKLQGGGYLDNSVLFVSADHGEIFEKGELAHGGARLNEPLIHIPLLVHLPGQRNSARIAESVQQVDLAPTILALAGLEAPGKMQGRSFLGLLTGEQWGGEKIFSMNLEQNYQHSRLKSGTVAVMDGSYKYVRSLETAKEELYDLRRDPAENENLAGKKAALAGRLREEIAKELPAIGLGTGAH